MLSRDEERVPVIMGESALYLALTKRGNNVNSLMEQLKSNEKSSYSDDRLCKIFEIILWLKKFISTGFEKQPVSYLYILSSLNEGKTGSSLQYLNLSKHTDDLTEIMRVCTACDGLHPV